MTPRRRTSVYNVARVYELLGEIDQAIAFYRRYRDMLPRQEQPERERTLTTLQRLEGARHVIDHAPEPAEHQRKRGVADTPFWTFAGLGTAASLPRGPPVHWPSPPSVTPMISSWARTAAHNERRNSQHAPTDSPSRATSCLEPA